MVMRFLANSQDTVTRRNALIAYFHGAVLRNDGTFLCPHFGECSKSHLNRSSTYKFIEGQLHHVGSYYDLVANNVDLRVAVVGQEYGGGFPHFSVPQRTGQISSVQSQRMRSDPTPGPYVARNQHMTGTTSALRILFGLGCQANRASEYIRLTSGRIVSIFDAFALVNFLLCSATDGTSSTGRATDIMLQNCAEHFKMALQLLEPTVIVWQGKKFWQRAQTIFNKVVEVDPNLFEVTYEVTYNGNTGSSQVLVGAFSHPSAPRYCWGNGPTDPYLVGVVEPTLLKILKLMGI
jgi:hypothetical protein